MTVRHKINYSAVMRDYACITVSALLTALAVNCIFQSTGLAPGGITGLAIIFSLITKIPVSYMTLCISIPLLVLGTLLLGKSFGIKTLYITLATPVCMKLVPYVDFSGLLSELPDILVLLLAAVPGGLLVGTAIGIALNHDCATGGTDLIALLIRHFFRFLKLSAILFVLDGSVVIASGFISGNFMIAVFSLLSLFIIIHTIKFVTSRKKDSK
ncbi:MAG: YitT family protein [Lachnospiraceae bacterium]|nr:YitT family protein [Lachnospiraceae bacterium]